MKVEDIQLDGLTVGQLYRAEQVFEKMAARARSELSKIESFLVQAREGGFEPARKNVRDAQIVRQRERFATRQISRIRERLVKIVR